MQLLYFEFQKGIGYFPILTKQRETSLKHIEIQKLIDLDYVGSYVNHVNAFLDTSGVLLKYVVYGCRIPSGIAPAAVEYVYKLSG